MRPSHTWTSTPSGQGPCCRSRPAQGSRTPVAVWCRSLVIGPSVSYRAFRPVKHFPPHGKQGVWDDSDVTRHRHRSGGTHADRLLAVLPRPVSDAGRVRHVLARLSRQVQLRDRLRRRHGRGPETVGGDGLPDRRLVLPRLLLLPDPRHDLRRTAQCPPPGGLVDRGLGSARRAPGHAQQPGPAHRGALRARCGGGRGAAVDGDAARPVVHARRARPRQHLPHPGQPGHGDVAVGGLRLAGVGLRLAGDVRRRGRAVGAVGRVLPLAHQGPPGTGA
ncbi:hypothetical protein SGPA1_40776 [Streptomyces misionensis JCM 4497]